ncbi:MULTISPECIES: hypothetical protein [unclassified Oceanobacillus]|uniref:hypothetical protein n=1 Tax=unclassified Oceanobacillus TaxID=2630292 RepID=UPI00300E3FC1
MRLFVRNKAEEAEDVEGKVTGRITVEKVSRYEHFVTAYLIDRSTGETVYKVAYKTIDPELQAYYKASDDMKRYIRNEDLILDGEISSNVSLPFVQAVEGKSGYGR